MKREKINFNVELKDAFGKVMTEPKEYRSTDMVPVILSKFVINALADPTNVSDEKGLDAVAIVKRLKLQQKVAVNEQQEFSTDELALIREVTLLSFNQKRTSSYVAGTVLAMTE